MGSGLRRDFVGCVQARHARANTWSMAARRPFIAGNWKMNPETVEEAVQLAKEIVAAAKTSKAQVSYLQFSNRTTTIP